MISRAAHLGAPYLRMSRSGGVATTAMKAASRMGPSRGAAPCIPAKTTTKAAAMIRPRAGVLHVAWVVMVGTPW